MVTARGSELPQEQNQDISGESTKNVERNQNARNIQKGNETVSEVHSIQKVSKQETNNTNNNPKKGMIRQKTKKERTP